MFVPAHFVGLNCLWILEFALKQLGQPEKVTVKCVSVGKPFRCFGSPKANRCGTDPRESDLCAWSQTRKYSTRYCVTPPRRSLVVM